VAAIWFDQLEARMRGSALPSIQPKGL
jgi:hypothetical protein